MDIISPNTSTSESPLQRFPIEMLCEAFAAIIAHYRQAIDDARHVKEVKLQHPSITLSHVCRTWRETAIAAPTLWRRIYIPGLSHKLVDLYLERSKESTLAVRIDYMPRQHKRAVESAVKTLNYMTRIGELCLVTEDRFARYYVHYLERPAPRLKLLALHIDPVHSMHYASRPQLEHKILNNIEKSPLRTLRLHSIIAPWTSSIFHGLTSLSIEFPTTSLTITELLDILDSTPDLVHMTYRDRCIRDTPMVHSPPYRRISLPRLLSLQLEMFCDDLECLCDNILMPSLVSWRFKAKCDQPTRSPRHPSRSFPFSEQIHSLVITASYYHTELLFAAKSPSHSDHPCNETILTSSLGYHEPTCHPVQVVAANIKSHSSAHLFYSHVFPRCEH
ncbi:hypothetical protein BD410DRAFT_59094 [Rickenella mellea]|uniref:Uncharacterized protein n=1 Tax=Rickenella mellea TaxID=50990 RepID=A0A4Y7QAN1_9AGAM|nr:hypothetical protein BD410DRAFT_59094 [Rickenella mellea]